jgi:phosphatidylserine decarboxylase
VGQYVEQGDDMGFIKFGSRVDMFVPMNTTVRVKINEIVRGNITIIGYISK